MAQLLCFFNDRFYHADNLIGAIEKISVVNLARLGLAVGTRFLYSDNQLEYQGVKVDMILN